MGRPNMIRLRAMSTAASQPAISKRKDSRGDQRRRRIFKSLHDCILAQGYVKTTLADVASGADMSASHLLYYFKGKEAILEQYFENVSIRFLEKIDEFSTLEPRQQIQSLADFWFKGEASTVQEIGFMLECFGAAVNDDVLRVTKEEFDERCKEYLRQIFDKSPSVFMDSSKDSAEISYGLMIGLRSAVYFDSDVDLADAHRLFLHSTLTMSGLE
jgi:AcrR family transcriptional regulator